MIGYVTLGTNDLARAEKFYDALLAELGAKRVMANDRMRFYGAGPGQPMIAVCTFRSSLSSPACGEIPFPIQTEILPALIIALCAFLVLRGKG